MAAGGDVEEAGEEEGDGEEERGGGGGAASNNLVRFTQLCLKISDHRQKIRLASIQHDTNALSVRNHISLEFKSLSCHCHLGSI